MKEIIKVNENELKVLTALAESYDSSVWAETGYFCFNSLSSITKLDRKQVRRACRSLKKKELADFLTGLVDEDGVFAGAGYGATEKGASFISHCDNCDKLNHYEYDIDLRTGKHTFLLSEDEDVVHIKECEEHYNKSIKHTQQNKLI
jgi:hypothetical protein